MRINQNGSFGIPENFFKTERNEGEKQIAKAPSAPLRGESSASIVTPSISDILRQNLSAPISSEEVHSPLIAGERASESKLIFSGEGTIGALTALEEGTAVYRSVAKISNQPPVFRG
jgi:hypothetical protein